MPDPGKGRRIAAPILSQNREAKDADTPALSDLSQKDKPWDKHRANCDTAAGYYAGSEFDEHGQRMTFCSQLLDFRLVPQNESKEPDGTYKLKLAAARFCRVRHCPVCQWRRSLMWKAKACKILPQVVADYPKYRWLFVTLTVKNCAVTELRETLEWMTKGFKRLSELKIFPAKGWIKTVEVTYGQRPLGSAHPHFHILMMVPSSYFGASYLSKDKWGELWQKSLRIDYKPVLDIQALKPQESPTGLLSEVIKYQCKESDLVGKEREWFLELTRQLHKTRAIAVGGVLRSYFKDLEKEPEDLIGDDQEEKIDEGHLYFSWRSRDKKYRLKN